MASSSAGRLLRRSIGQHGFRPPRICRYTTTSSPFLQVSEELREAIHAKKPIVALETTIYTHGFPYPDNIALASYLESVVRTNGAIPATIGVLNGVARVGLGPEQLIELAASAGQPKTLKLSRRDLSYITGMSLADKNFNGGTTIAGTMVLAHLAGIKVFATGGLGGVHRGAESSMDISADLTELGRTPVTVISSGCKSFLDIPRTLEYLETEGVGVATFADGRTGDVEFPAFWSRESGMKSPLTLQNEKEAAAVIHAHHSLGLTSGLLFANPIPEQASIPKAEMETIIEEAISQANASGASGKDNTPFILSKIKELTQGRSIPANRELIASNVKRGAIVAKELSRLELEGVKTPSGTSVANSSVPPQTHEAIQNTVSKETRDAQHPNVIVAGALAVDLSCDYAPLEHFKASPSPHLQTSNPARITQTLGGVAHNVARAAHLLGSSVVLCSAVADDLSGRSAISQLTAENMTTRGVTTLPSSTGYRTAQYVAVNDLKKDLLIAMADMGILEQMPITDENMEPLKQASPGIVVVDANWPPQSLRTWLVNAKSRGAVTAFEPVSVAKAIGLFKALLEHHDRSVFPKHLIDIATPNSLELSALHDYASSQDFFSLPEWWSVIDSLGIPSSGARSQLAMATSPALVDTGIPQQSLRLLPFIPCILTKLGAEGVLMTRLLPANDGRLTNPDYMPYILSRSQNESKDVGGVYMRLFPPAEVVPEKEIVSVNGVGDTFLGAAVAGIVGGRPVEDCVMGAQRAAVMTLKSKESVSPELRSLRGSCGEYDGRATVLSVGI